MTETKPLTAAELEEIRERAEAATSGPWKECGASNGRCQCGQVWSKPADAPVATCNKEWGDGPDMIYGSLPDGHRENNAIFIAASRTDIPALLVTVDALRAALRDVANWADSLNRTGIVSTDLNVKIRALLDGPSALSVALGEKP
jgi:hypothetical protein